MKINRVCLECKNTFIWNAHPSKIKSGWGKFCSKKCNATYHIKNEQIWKKLIGKKAHNNNQKKIYCKVCNKLFYVSPSNSAKYCSLKCAGIGRGSSPWLARYKWDKGHIPINKGKHFLALRGNNNPNWRGGITKLKDKIRGSLEYKEWRVKVFRRDDYTCRLCGKRDHNLINADHFPKTFSQLLIENKIKTLKNALKCSEIWNVDNARTLCIDCHRNTPSYFNRWWAKP